MEMKNVKGSYDYGTQEERVRAYIRNTLTKVFVKYGYQGIETPIINYYDLMTLKYNDDAEILNEVYKLSDQGGRKLALRYDLTVPFAKYIAMNKDLILPFKRFEIGNVFRDGPVKVGRNREFIQCDVDVVGIDNRLIEAELMSLYIEGYKALDIEVTLKYNNRKIMQGMIEECGIESEKVSDVITVIDKFDKLSDQEIKIEFTNIGLGSDTISKLLEVFKLDFKGIKLKYGNSDNVNLIEGIEEIDELNTYIDKLGLRDVSTFSAVLARGQSYYTGVVFEVYEKNGIISSAIGGGGRYDNLITDFIDDGNKYPAVGVSFGLDVIYTIIKDREEFKKKSLIDLYIIPLDTQLESLRIANKLREMGYNIEIDSSKRKIGKAINFADKSNIENVLILGSDEVLNKEFSIKNIVTKELIKVKYDDELNFKIVS